MHIAQITDIHISTDHQPVHDIDVVSNFKSVLSNVLSDDQVSHIALTGDLCFQDATISVMEWVKSELDAAGKPYFTIPGNHDDSVVMGQVFDREGHLHSDELYYNVEFDDVQLIFLDTGKGQMSVDQISWLKAIDQVVKKPSLIFMHHPPVYAVPYMDANYAVQGMDEIQDVLSGLENARAVFCGHYHVAKTIQQPGMPVVHITPSTFFQLDDRDEEFRVGSKQIGWRKISWKDTQLQTSVKWL